MKSVIKYSIISRGTLLLIYDNKELKISGELTFEPPVFYADLSSLNTWEKPAQIQLTNEEKENILTYFENQNKDDRQTKVLFE